jgi:hypothetical protein
MLRFGKLLIRKVLRERGVLTRDNLKKGRGLGLQLVSRDRALGLTPQPDWLR